MGTVKYSGPIASFHCPTEATIRSLKVHFSPKQLGEGTPSPENIRPIEGQEGVEVYRNGSTINYEFGVLGKNKLSDNLEDYTLVNAPTDVIFSNGSFSGTITEGQRDVAICKPNTKYPAGTYTLSFDYVNNIGNTYWRPVLISKYNDSSWYSALISTDPAAESSGHYTKTFTTDEDFYVHLTLNCFATASTTAINSISNLQLELGSTATAYEPYDPNKTVYGGWVDLVSGEVCEEWHKMVIDTTSRIGLFPWGGVKTDATTGTEYAIALFRRESTDPKAHTIKDNLCDKLPMSTNQNQINVAYVYDGDTYGPAISLPTSVIGTTNETLTEYLTDNPFTFVYKQRVPNTYHLAPTSMQTFLSQNNIWSNADYVEVEYDLHETQNILARKQFIIANQPHVVKPAAAPLQNFVTDMAAPLKECKVEFKPVQDLHGYDKPWVGGGGKNLFDSSQIGSSTSAAFITLQLVADTTYTFSSNKPSGAGGFSVQITNTDLEAAGAVYDNHPITFTALNDASISIRYYNGSDTSLQDYWYQLEKGSTATSYEPYENICPISGWTGLEAYRTEKSLVRFGNSIGPTNRLYNGFSGWSLDGYWKIPDRTQTYTYSVYINNKDAEGDSCVNVWFRNETNTSYIRTVNGSKIKAGEEGWSTLSFNNNNYYFAGLGISLQPGGIAKNGMLEIGDTATAYESYNGTTIPITFPSEAGTIYGGYVNLVTGELIREAIKVTTNEIVSFHDITDRGNGVYEICLNLPIYARSERKTEAKCNCFVYGSTSTGIADRFDLTYVLNQKARQVRISHYFEEAPTIDVYKEYLQSIGFEVVYYVDPESYSISPQTLKSLRGQNNIWSNTNGNIELKYWTH